MSDDKYEISNYKLDINSIKEIDSKFKKLEQIKDRVDEANRLASVANEKAQEVSEKKVGLRKKPIIEDLQLSQALQADAVTKNADALKILFEYQEGLTKITSELFFLGCESIATNNYVINQLEKKIKGASVDSMDDMAKNEFINVIKQLKDRQDVMNKLATLETKVKEQGKVLTSLKDNFHIQQNNFQNIESRFNSFDDRINAAEDKLHMKEEVNNKLKDEYDFVERIYTVNSQNDKLLLENKELRDQNGIFLKKYKKTYAITILVFLGIISIMILVFVLMYKFK